MVDQCGLSCNRITRPLLPRGTILRRQALCAGRAQSPGGGNVKSLKGDGWRPHGGVLARAHRISSDSEASGSVCRDSRFHGRLWTSWCRWDATSPTHPLAIAVQERIDAEAFLQGCRPPQSPRLPQPFLPQEREDGIVCVALHARREQPEVAHVVPVAVGDVVGERGQELGRGVRSLDGAFGARVLRHKIGFLDG